MLVKWAWQQHFRPPVSPESLIAKLITLSAHSIAKGLERDYPPTLNVIAVAISMQLA